ncbi:hypothetical protein AC1031_021252 [Aphanomyces cochlioides]|nr:hypothetical protein AC1031_021252 [Aphanomyces cochlioides]
MDEPAVETPPNIPSRNTSPPSSASSFTPASLDDDRPLANERIKVYIRVRPLSSFEASLGHTEIVSASTTSLRIPSSSSQTQIECSFDSIFPSASTQSEIYAAVQPLVADVLEGFNATIFAYGQTGTGKTHTILGMDEAALACRGSTPDLTLFAPSWGIIPRALCQLVEATTANTSCSISCAYLQIYNEKIFDLLTDKKRQKPLALREALDGSSEMVVQGLSSYPITSLSDVMAFLKRGKLHRVVRETEMNAQSSRSHAILQVTFKSETKNGHLRAKLNMVDLAGSEKWNKQACKPGVEIEEMKNINTSLSALGNCIAALTQPGRKHIPYRDSSLTRLLQDSLGGNTRTVLIATITARASDETVRTIQFADRTRAVMQCVVQSQAIPMSPRQLHLGTIYMFSSPHKLPKGLTAARAHIAKLKQKLHDLAEQKDKQADISDRMHAYEAQMREKEHAIEKLLEQNEAYQRMLRDGEEKIQKLEEQIQVLSTPPKVSRPSNNQVDPVNASRNFLSGASPARNMPLNAFPTTSFDDKTKSSVLYRNLYGATKQPPIVQTKQPDPVLSSLSPAASIMTRVTAEYRRPTSTEGGACLEHKLRDCILCALRQKGGSFPTMPTITTSLPSIQPRQSPRSLSLSSSLPKMSVPTLSQELSVCSIHHLTRCVLCNRASQNPSNGPQTETSNICTPHGLNNCILCARLPLRSTSFPNLTQQQSVPATIKTRLLDR